MRFVSTLKNDMRYQMKYGFYFLYTFFTVLYIVLLVFCPDEYKIQVASIIILSDPAMLGSFFIGAIWLLEKDEGLHGYWSISPLRPIEYILSKAISLAIISTVSADLIVLIGLREVTDYFALSIGVFMGSTIFTTIGLIVASYARSVNHYMLLIAPLELVVTLPPIIAVFGISHPIFDVLPGFALWRIINDSIDGWGNPSIWLYLILVIWLGISLVLAHGRIEWAMQARGGEVV